MTIDEAITRYNNNAEHELTLGNLQGCLEFRQLAEWLEDYKWLKEQELTLGKIKAEIKEHADRLKDSLYGDGMRHCIDIIDKYIEESKGEE